MVEFRIQLDVEPTQEMYDQLLKLSTVKGRTFIDYLKTVAPENIDDLRVQEITTTRDSKEVEMSVKIAKDAKVVL